VSSTAAAPPQNRWKCSFDWRRRYSVAESNVELHGNSCFLQIAQKADPHPFIVRTLLDLPCGHARRVEDQSVLYDWEDADLPEDGLEEAGGTVTY